MQFDNLEKFRIKVNGGYLLVRPLPGAGPQAPIICRLEVLAGDNKGVPVINCHPATGGDAFAVAADSGRILWDLPPTGFFTFGDGCQRLIRRPNRTYKVGLTSENSDIYDVTSFKRQLNLPNAMASAGYLALVSNSYISFAGAVERLLAEGAQEKAIPISRNLVVLKNSFGIISLTHAHDALCWFYKGNVNYLSSVPESMLYQLTKTTPDEFKEVIRNV